MKKVASQLAAAGGAAIVVALFVFAFRYQGDLPIPQGIPDYLAFPGSFATTDVAGGYSIPTVAATSTGVSIGVSAALTRGGTEHHATLEAEVAAGQIGGALGSALDDLRTSEDLRIAGSGSEHAGIAQDAGQEIVEVVGDPAGEGAYGLHLLHVANLGFELDAGR